MACKTKIPALDSNRKELSDMCKFLRVKQKEGTIFNVSFTSKFIDTSIDEVPNSDIDDDGSIAAIAFSKLTKCFGGMIAWKWQSSRTEE